MGSHDAYGKRVLRLATNGAVELSGSSIEVDFGVGRPGRIDGAIGGEIAIEVESRTSKQIRGAILDLICHPYPKKLLVLLPAHMSSPSIALKQSENLLSRFLESKAFQVSLLKGNGKSPLEKQDAKLVSEALDKLGFKVRDKAKTVMEKTMIQPPAKSAKPEGKYKLLFDYLVALPKSSQEETLSFRRIEQILGSSLPKSARNYQAWWANQADVSNRPHAKAWLAAGFQVQSIRQHESESWVRFRRK